MNLERDSNLNNPSNRDMTIYKTHVKDPEDNSLSSNNHKQVVKMSASDVAKHVSPPSSTPEKYLVFGKVFEEAYTLMTYIGRQHQAMSGFCGDVAARLRKKGFYEKKLVTRARRMAACLLDAGATGRKPKTQKKWIGSRAIVYAQPDLIETGDYTEFKTGPIDEYARTQAKVFCSVIGKPIRLIGLEENDAGYFNAESEKITGSDFDLKSVVDEMTEGMGFDSVSGEDV